MNKTPRIRIEKCILAYKHGDLTAPSQRLIVDFRQVPLNKVGKLCTYSGSSADATGNWLEVVEWLSYSLLNNVIGPTNCSAVLLGENFLTLELVVTTAYMEDARASVVEYLGAYGIGSEFAHQ